MRCRPSLAECARRAGPDGLAMADGGDKSACRPACRGRFRSLSRLRVLLSVLDNMMSPGLHRNKQEERMDQIALSELKIANPWTAAGPGALVQVNGFIGLRCTFDAQDCLLVVSGNPVAKIVTAADVGEAVGIDVSSCFELVAIDPGASMTTAIGAVLFAGGEYFVRALLNSEALYVCVRGSNVGQVVRRQPPHVVLVARLIGARERAKPI
jgi:hypothetical protein